MAAIHGIRAAGHTPIPRHQSPMRSSPGSPAKRLLVWQPSPVLLLMWKAREDAAWGE
jgi:hypothetical protein